VGKGGIIIKSREEQLKEYEESVLQQQGEVGLKNHNLSDLEQSIQKITNKPEKIMPKKEPKKVEPKEPIQEIIYDEE
jgi:hypothetical protein